MDLILAADSRNTVYAAYLVFLLYSHTHLYKDSKAGAKSRRFSTNPSTKLMKLVRVPSSNQNRSDSGTHPRSSSATLRGPSSQSLSASDCPNGTLRTENSLSDVDAKDTVKLVQKDDFVWDTVSYLYSADGSHSDASEETFPDDNDGKEETKHDEVKEPKLSWFMTASILSVVTVVRVLLSSLMAVPESAF
jgi:Ca2+/H+ antiporter